MIKRLTKLFNKNTDSKQPLFQKKIPLQQNLTIDTLRIKNFKGHDKYQDDQTIFENFLSDPNRTFKITYQQGAYLEEFICALYRLAGYQANITPKPDKGIDIIVTDDNHNKLLIQCKNYTISNNFPSLVGETDIQKFNGISEQGQKIFITTSFFQGTINKEKYPDITFIDRRGLLILVQQLVPEFYSEFLFKQEMYENFIQKCDKCWNGVMIHKKGKKDNNAFRACSNYPKCKHIEKAILPNLKQ